MMLLSLQWNEDNTVVDNKTIQFEFPSNYHEDLAIVKLREKSDS